MNESQYLLSFDLSDITQNVSELQATYYSLTEEIKRSSEASSDLVDRVGGKLDSLTAKLNNSLQGMNVFYSKITANFVTMTDTFKKLSRYSSSISRNLKAINSLDFSGFGQVPGKSVGERVEAVSPGSGFTMSMDLQAMDSSGAKEALGVANQALEAAKKAIEDAEKAKGIMSRLRNIAKREAQGATSAIGGMVKSAGSSVGLQNLGGGPLSVMSGLASLIFLGVQYEQRVKAERGEMLNAAEAAGGILEGGVKKGIKQLAAFAEHAQWQFGISRKEVQKTVAQLSNLGIKMDESFTGIYEDGKGFEDVTKNVVTLSLAIDKNLNIAGGTSMERAISLMENYGYSINSAVDKIKNLSLNAKESGMNIQRFVNSVMDSAASLVQYQIEISDVEQVMTGLKNKYTEMGIDPKRAGSVAGDVTKGLAGGLMNMSIGHEMAVAQKLFPEVKSALEARTKMKDRFMNPKDEDDKQNFMLKMMNAYREVITRPGMSRSEAVTAMELELGDYQQAQAIYDFVPALLAAKEEGATPSDKTLKEFSKAFETEGKTLTDLYKTQKQLVKHLAEMGKGALKIIVGIHNILVVGIKNIIALIASLGITDPSKREDVMNQIEVMSAKQFDLLGEGMSQMFEGGAAAFKSLAPFFSELLQRGKEAWDYDPGGLIDSIFDDLKTFKGEVIASLDEVDARIADFQAMTFDILGKLPGVDESQAEAMSKAYSKLAEKERTSAKITRESFSGRLSGSQGKKISGVVTPSKKVRENQSLSVTGILYGESFVKAMKVAKENSPE